MYYIAYGLHIRNIKENIHNKFLMLLNRLAAGFRCVAVLPRYLALGLRGKDRSLLVSEVVL